MPTKKDKRDLPRFRSEQQERAYWSEHDSTEHIDWSQGRRVAMPKLRPTLRTISIRLPVMMLEEIKILANKRDVPYQSLIKIMLSDSLKRELP